MDTRRSKIVTFVIEKELSINPEKSLFGLSYGLVSSLGRIFSKTMKLGILWHGNYTDLLYLTYPRVGLKVHKIVCFNLWDSGEPKHFPGSHMGNISYNHMSNIIYDQFRGNHD